MGACRGVPRLAWSTTDSSKGLLRPGQQWVLGYIYPFHAWTSPLAQQGQGLLTGSGAGGLNRRHRRLRRKG